MTKRRNAELAQKDMKLVTIRLPEAVREQLRAYAEKKDMSIQQILEAHILTLLDNE